LKTDPGAIWVNAIDGLFRFAGQNIRHYGRKDSLLKDSAILSLTEGQDGTIWVSINAGGMHRLRQDRLENLGEPRNWAWSACSSDCDLFLAETRDGALWMGIIPAPLSCRSAPNALRWK
jgi:ligand-binding sensor domain-containing protein